MQKILIVCSGNTCRSPMAQHLLIKLLGEQGIDCIVLSAGLAAGDGMPASEGAITAMRLEGIDLAGHRSQRLHPEMAAGVDLILTMTAHHRLFLEEFFPEMAGYIYTMGEYAGEGKVEIMDPYGQGVEAYLATLRQLKDLTAKIAGRIADHHHRE